MRKPSLLIAMLILGSPFASSSAEDSPSLIVRGTLNCQTGAVHLSAGVLGNQQFPSWPAALDALVNKKAITATEAKKVDEAQPHICKLRPGAQHSGDGNVSPNPNAGDDGPGLLLEGVVGKQTIPFSLSAVNFSTYKSLKDYVDKQRRTPLMRRTSGAGSFINFVAAANSEPCTVLTAYCMFCPPKFYCNWPRSL